MPRVTNVLNVCLGVRTGVPNETIVLPPTEQFLQLSLARGPLPAAAQNHAPTMTVPGSCWPFPTTPVVSRATDKLVVVVDVLQDKSAAPRPVQHLSKENCLSPTRGALPAGNGNHAPTHELTQFRWTTPHHCGQHGQRGLPMGGDAPRTSVSTSVACYDEGTTKMVKTIQAQPPPSISQPQGNSPTDVLMGIGVRGKRMGETGCRACPCAATPSDGTASLGPASTAGIVRGRQNPAIEVDVGKLLLGRVGVPPTGVLMYVVCQDGGARNMVQTSTNAVTGTDKMMPVERATRRGKTRTGGRRSYTLMVWCLLAATLLMVDVVQAVFAPADRAVLKAAVGSCTWQHGCTGGCLGETADGSCPIFAASTEATTGTSYGVIGAWDVSAVTSMQESRCTLSLF